MEKPAPAAESGAEAEKQGPETEPAAKSETTAPISLEAFVAPEALAESIQTLAPPGAIEKTHDVKEGETLDAIAAEYGVTPAQLRAWNNFEETDTPFPGEQLVLYLPAATEEIEAPETWRSPAEYGSYTVRRGDNLHEIAVRLGTTKAVLIELNKLRDANHIVTGQKLKYPPPPAKPAP